MVNLTPRQIMNMIRNATSIELEIVWIPKFLQTYTKEDMNIVGVFETLYIKELYQKIQNGNHIDISEAYKAKNKLMNYSAQYSAMTA